MKPISLLALSTGICLLTLTGCHDKKDNPVDTITEQGFNNCFAVIKDNQGIEPTRVISPVSIGYLLNWTKAKCDAAISGLSLGNQNLPLITLSDMTWSVDSDGWGKIDVESPKQSAGNVASAPIISDFEFEWLFRLDLSNVTNEYDPVGSFEFELDNRYSVAGSRQPSYLGGTTTVTCPQVDPFSYNDATYTFELDFTKMTAKLYINKAKFNADMPSLNMTFSDIPFTFGNDLGSFELRTAQLTPEMAGRPMPRFPITNFSATVYPGHTTTLSFDCTPETMPMQFHVSASVNGEDYSAAL